MRIIGGRDYYDGAAPFDADMTRVFKRNRFARKYESFDYGSGHEAPIDAVMSSKTLSIRGEREDEVPYTRILVLFCGRIYSGVAYTAVFNSWAYFWSPSKLLAHMESKGHCFYEPSYGRPPFRWLYGYSDVSDLFKSYDVFRESMDFIRQEKILTGVALYHGKSPLKWNLNVDSLGEIGFASVVPPVQAYQELDMFLGTILVDDPDKMVKVSDATLAAKHGFDEWSFRNKVHPAKPRSR